MFPRIQEKDLWNNYAKVTSRIGIYYSKLSIVIIDQKDESREITTNALYKKNPKNLENVSGTSILKSQMHIFIN